MPQISRVTFLVAYFVFLVAIVSAQKSGDAIDGVQIVKRMAARYASAKSYRDEGAVRSISRLKNGQTQEINTFRTFFVRPKKFRFEWNDVGGPQNGDLNIVWTGGDEVFSYSPLLGMEKEEDLDMAIAGATGISRGAAHSIPVLLFPDKSGFRVTEMNRITLTGEERFEGANCYVVKGFHPFGFAIELWIGKDDFLLRRILEHNDDGTVDEEIRRNISVDGAISDDSFRFTPPKPGERLIGCLSIAIIPIGLAVYFGSYRKTL